MNFLKKSIAPITEKAWKEMEEVAGQIFKIYLTARRFVDIEGPNGPEEGGVSTGRLNVPEDQAKSGVNYGIREILPFVEIRKPFELNLWELDNLERGAKDVDLSPLEEAAKDVASFEETAIYHGFEPAGIVGLQGTRETSSDNYLTIPENSNEFLKEIGNQVISLKRNGVEGPYTLVVNELEWLNLINLSQGYPVQKQLKEILGGNVILTHSTKNSFLLSERGGDFELTLGQDISLGYKSHDTETVKLYFTSSFTFRVLTPEAVVVFYK